jgi:hypothetical protein
MQAKQDELANVKLQAQDGRQMPIHIIEAHGRQREVNVLRGRPNAVWKSLIPAAALLGAKYIMPTVRPVLTS